VTPAALNREQAAEYVGVSPNSFDKLVRAGEMPKGRRFRNVDRLVWRVSELGEYLARVPVDGGEAPADLEDADI
jgi:predicted DNA-binding transcriptional regulator AlpA